jgi:site-specific recombinase XerD
MGVTLKFIFRESKKVENKSNKGNPLGSVYLLRTENRKPVYRSLSLPPIRKNQWDSENQRVRRNQVIPYELYNQKIDETLTQVLNDGKSLTVLDGISNRDSFLNYFEKVLNGPGLEMKHGTRYKYDSVFKKLKDFLKHKKKKTDLLFSELTLELIEGFQVYMEQSKMEKNTVIHYLKIVRVIIRKSQREKLAFSIYDPFMNYKFPKRKKKGRVTLTKDEIKFIRDFKFESKRLERVRDLFLFQFLMGGLRASDLISLKYNNFKDGRMEYYMFKTGKFMDTVLTETVLDIVNRLVDFNINIDDSSKSQSDLPKNEKSLLSELKRTRDRIFRERHKGGKPSPFPTSPPSTFQKDIPLSIFLREPVYQYYNEPRIFIQSLTFSELTREYQLLKKFIDNKGVYTESLSSRTSMGLDLSKKYLKNEKFINQVFDEIGKGIEKRKKTYYKNCLAEFKRRSVGKDTKNKFLFGRLKDSDFESIGDDNDFKNLTPEQYRKVNKSTIVYNRNLKEIQKVMGIEKSMTSHLARTSFTNIMVNNGMSDIDTSRALGHSSLVVTSLYLDTGFKKRQTDDTINSLDELVDN